MSDGVQQGTVLPGGAVIEELLAEGRLCTVYRARLSSGEEAVARVLRADLAGDLAEWFLATARTRASLDHPVLPKVYAYGYVNGLPVEVTELLAGRTAQDLLDQGQNGLDVPTAVRMVRSIAAALDHLHATTPPTLHRALLPEHVLVRERDGAVVLLAVGEADRPRIAVTRPAYLSPEELADVSALSPRADVFSLATLTYELFTGRPAFVGGGDVVLDTVRMARFPRLREHRPDIHARAEHILREAWALSPEDRPLTAGRFASLFAEAVNQQAQTLVNIPAAPPPAESDAAKSTLTGPGPLDLAARKALQEVRAHPEPAAPAPTAQPAAAVMPTRTPVSSPRAPRGGRVPSQRPRSFLPKPGEGGDDATRPEILVPGSVRGDTEALAEATPVDGTASPGPRFARTTPGIPSPLPSTPQPIASSATIPDARGPDSFGDVGAPRPVVAPPQRADPPTASSPSPRASPPPAAREDSPTPAVTVEPAASAEPVRAAPGPLTGTPFEPPPSAQPPAPTPSPPTPYTASEQVAPPAAGAAMPPHAATYPSVATSSPVHAPSSPEAQPWPPRDDEDTQVFNVPSQAPPAARSPVLIAAALIANAIVIVGIAHAIAWAQQSRTPPTVIQAPPPVCAPCARCPAPPACPEPVCPVVAPVRTAPAPRPPAPRPAPPTPARPGVIRSVPSF